MKVSTAWLQKYFKESLPTPEKLADLFTFHSSEVEGMVQQGNDTILDLKVLPDRAHYMLSHRGVAFEISSITAMSRIVSEIKTVSSTLTKTVAVKNEAPELCSRYMAQLIENSIVGESPKEMQQALESIGARSINSIVDATNYVMFDVGQPLHAFDADKVVGTITIRKASEGEKIVILDGREMILNASMLVIADDEGPIAIAGVKGGKRAEVTAATKNIIIEAANFNPVSVRQTSTKLNIRNDSSKRFENEITPHLAEKGLNEVVALIVSQNKNAQVSPSTDINKGLPAQRTIEVPLTFIQEALGVTISGKEVEHILKQMECNIVLNKGIFSVTVPHERLDLVIPEDFVEEVGRIYGYDKIPAKVLEKTKEVTPINKTTYWSEKIKDTLVAEGYSEVSTYALTNKGAVEIQNPLASDKGFLRTNLHDGIEKSLTLNVRNADILNLNQIKIFEIGTVFTKEAEHLSLCIGISNVKGRKATKEAEAFSTTMKALESILGTSIEKKGSFNKNIFEINLAEVIETLPEPKNWDVAATSQEQIIYKTVSPYPFIVRDIAVFVPTTIAQEKVVEIIDSLAGPLKVRRDLFDVFTKKFEDGGEKTSYAFRIVFQAPDRTLTDEEINIIMKQITDAMNANKDWQVR